MTTIISFIIVIGIIVFVHELGHFLAAKLSGVRVEVFSLGFPPKMISRKIGETEYQLAWIPLGGFVKMSGMADESFDDDYDPNDPRGFSAQSFPKRVFIITAGVIMNVVLAFVIYSILTWSSGVGRVSGTAVSEVNESWPAAEVGMQGGDRIIEVGGVAVSEWNELTDVIRVHPDQPIGIAWMRDDSLYMAELTPRGVSEFNLASGEMETVGKIGVAGSMQMEPVGPLTAMIYGAGQVYWVVRLNVVSLTALVSGKASVSELTGPIGIARLSGESARSGLFSFFSFIALISVSIGFLNILPIPMLDGGYLAFMLVEAVIRRPIPDKVKLNLMRVGLAMLLALVVFVSYHDILRVFFNNE